MFELKLPEGILKDKIIYCAKGVHGKPMVIIPLRIDLTAQQFREIADVIAEYVKVQTGTPQEVLPLTDSLCNLRNLAGDSSKPLNLNYRMFQDTADKSELVQAKVYVFTEPTSVIEPKTLETFVNDLRQ